MGVLTITYDDGFVLDDHALVTLERDGCFQASASVRIPISDQDLQEIHSLLTEHLAVFSQRVTERACREIFGLYK